jgi:hypothetical protein
MKRLLRFAALLTLLGTIAFWTAKGAHPGWSQDRVPVSKTDEITGIVFTAYEDRYVPGIDILGGGALLSALLLVSSFFIRTTSTPKTQP